MTRACRRPTTPGLMVDFSSHDFFVQWYPVKSAAARFHTKSACGWRRFDVARLLCLLLHRQPIKRIEFEYLEKKFHHGSRIRHNSRQSNICVLQHVYLGRNLLALEIAVSRSLERAPEPRLGTCFQASCCGSLLEGWIWSMRSLSRTITMYFVFHTSHDTGSFSRTQPGYSTG